MVLYCYYNNTIGCFMEQGFNIYKLNDCDYYDESFGNQLNCQCGIELESDPISSLCNNEDDCFKPYCIGNPNCYTYYNNQPISTCSTESQHPLYKCTSADFGSDKYVYYKYIDKSMLDIITQSMKLYIQLIPKKSNIFLYVVIIISIFVAILLIYFLLIKK